jgi:UrcA family protein
MTKFLVSIALAASLTTAAQAAPAAETFTASVRAGDLNLASAGGLATLRGRVRAVADRYCGVAPAKPLIETMAIARCHAELERSAASQVALALSQTDTAVVGTR